MSITETLSAMIVSALFASYVTAFYDDGQHNRLDKECRLRAYCNHSGASESLCAVVGSRGQQF